MKKLGLMAFLLSSSAAAFARPEWVEVSGAYKNLDKSNQYVLTYISEASGDAVLYYIDDKALPHVLLKCLSFDKPCKKFKAYLNWYPSDRVQEPFSAEGFILRIK